MFISRTTPIRCHKNGFKLLPGQQDCSFVYLAPLGDDCLSDSVDLDGLVSHEAFDTRRAVVPSCRAIPVGVVSPRHG